LHGITIRLHKEGSRMTCKLEWRVLTFLLDMQESIPEAERILAPLHEISATREQAASFPGSFRPIIRLGFSTSVSFWTNSGWNLNGILIWRFP
jgi:hypothetical protein